MLTGVAAATQAGPATVLSYVILGIACAYSALSYARLAAAVGGCVSADGYPWVAGLIVYFGYSRRHSQRAVGCSEA